MNFTGSSRSTYCRKKIKEIKRNAVESMERCPVILQKKKKSECMQEGIPKGIPEEIPKTIPGAIPV